MYLGQQGLEFGGQQMLGMESLQRGHLGLQELATEGKGLGGAFPALLEAQPHGGDGLGEVRRPRGRDRLGEPEGGALGPGIQFGQGLAGFSLKGAELGLGAVVDGGTLPRSRQPHRQAQAGHFLVALLGVTAPQAPPAEFLGFLEAEAALLQIDLGQQCPAKGPRLQALQKIFCGNEGNGPRIRQGDGGWREFRQGEESAPTAGDLATGLVELLLDLQVFPFHQGDLVRGIGPGLETGLGGLEPVGDGGEVCFPQGEQASRQPGVQVGGA